MTSKNDLKKQIEKYLSGGQTLATCSKWVHAQPIGKGESDELNRLLLQVMDDIEGVLNKSVNEKDLRKAWRRMLNAMFMKGK